MSLRTRFIEECHQLHAELEYGFMTLAEYKLACYNLHIKLYGF